MADVYKKYKTYSQDVLKGKIIAGKLVKLSCKRYLNWFKRKDIYFDTDEVERCIKFIKHLKHTSENHYQKPFELSDFQEFIIYNIYGWKWKKSKLRVIKNVYIEIARKNGKSAFSAAIVCYELLKGNPSTEIDFIASNKKQASICFEMAKKFLQTLNLNNAKYFKFYRDKIKFNHTDSFIQVLSSDADNNDGFNASLFIADEFHSHKSGIYNVLKSSQNARPEPLAIVITTAGYNVAGAAYEMHKYCESVLNGKQEDDTQFSLIFNLDEGDDYRDEKVWKKTNPNLGITVLYDNLRDEVKRAATSPSFENECKTKYFNIWCNSKQTWISNDIIEKNSKVINLEDFRGFYATGGIDLAVVRDLTAFSLMIENNGKYYFKTYYYVPQTALENNANSELYKKWHKQGYLIVTPSNTTDYDYILNDLLNINKKYEILYKSIGYDQFNATYFAIKGTEQGLPLQPYSQAIYNFNKPTKEFERLLLENQIVIDDNPITKWCFSNVNIKTDHNDNIKPVKENLTSNNKIDGVISILMSMGVELGQVQIAPQIFT